MLDIFVYLNIKRLKCHFQLDWTHCLFFYYSSDSKNSLERNYYYYEFLYSNFTESPLYVLVALFGFQNKNLFRYTDMHFI